MACRLSDGCFLFGIGAAAAAAAATRRRSRLLMLLVLLVVLLLLLSELLPSSLQLCSSPAGLDVRRRLILIQVGMGCRGDAAALGLGIGFAWSSVFAWGMAFALGVAAAALALGLGIGFGLGTAGAGALLEEEVGGGGRAAGRGMSVFGREYHLPPSDSRHSLAGATPVAQVAAGHASQALSGPLPPQVPVGSRNSAGVRHPCARANGGSSPSRRACSWAVRRWATSGSVARRPCRRPWCPRSVHLNFLGGIVADLCFDLISSGQLRHEALHAYITCDRHCGGGSFVQFKLGRRADSRFWLWMKNYQIAGFT